MTGPDAGSHRHPGCATWVAPYAIVRLAGVAHPAPPEETAGFRAALEAFVDKETELASMACRLEEMLHDSAASHPAEFHQKVVLPLRRDVHNGRDPKPATLESLGVLPDRPPLPHRLPLLAAWLAGRAELVELAAAVRELWPQALAAERKSLARLCGAEALRRAAVLSGQDLPSGIDRTARCAGEPDRRARKAEPAVLRYALRISTKTSPFSWYAAVGWGQWEGSFVTPPVAVAHARVNHVLTSRLVATLLHDPARRQRLPHRLAPAVRERDGQIQFYRDVPVQGAARAYLTHEETVEVAAGGPLRFVVEAVRGAGGKGISPAELAELLAARLPHGNSAQAAAFVDRLLHIGLVIPVAPVDPQEPDAAGALADWLRETGDRELASRLDVLNGQTAGFVGLPPEQRAVRLGELAEGWRRLGEAAGADLTGITPLHEDVVFPETVPLGRPTPESLASLTPLLMIFDRQLLIRRLARNLFVRRFGIGGSTATQDCAGLLQAALVEGLTIRPGEDGEIDRLLGIRAELASRMPEDGTIPDAVVQAASSLLPGWLTARPVSYSFFLQPIPGGGLDTGLDGGLVANHLYAGFGRFASRFLEWLPSRARTTLAQAITGVQLRPVAGFNPNLHPVLTGREIGEDARWADLTPQRLLVQHDPESDEIRLRAKDTGELVDVHYLGFLMPLALPDRFAALYSDLACGWVDLSPLRSVEERDGVLVKGRLRYREVVLERRSWEFDAQALLAEVPLAEAGNAVAAARLRARHGLPGHVFVGTGGSITSRADFEARLGAPKPQYVDFGNALHLRCLSRLLSRYDGRIQVTEALPVPGGQAMELIAETYRRAG